MRAVDAGKQKPLFIAGAYEFISDDGHEHALPQAYPPLVKAYDMLRYDAGVLSPAEAKNFADMKIAGPQGWLTLEAKAPVVKMLTTNVGKVAVVFLPVGKKPGDGPTPDQEQAIARALKDARSQARLVVGVSPWGVQAESDYLENAKPDLDVLLGSGSGVGFSAKPAQASRVLWMHTYSKGKAIYTVDLLALPGEKGFKWELGTNYLTQAVVLDDTYTPDQAMTGLLADVPDPGDKKDAQEPGKQTGPAN